MKKKSIKMENDNQFFLSISDLMTGVLLIFALLYAKEIVKNEKFQNENKDLYAQIQKSYKLEAERNILLKEVKVLREQNKLLNQQVAKLKEYEQLYLSMEEELEKFKEENRDLVQKTKLIENLQNQVAILQKRDATIEELHEKINSKLLEAFKDDKDIKIDTIKQELILDDNVLFGINEWQLKEVGKEKLQKILPKFFATFVDDESVITYLEQLTIEGHTDDLGSADPQRNYLYNLDLSQKRAYEVARFIYSDEQLTETLGEDRLKKLKIYLSSNGKSNANLIYKDIKEKVVDRDKSRRVTIKYRLDIQKMLKHSMEDI